MSKELVNYYRIEKAIGYLTENFKEQPDLDEIAKKVYMSSYHFQRIFTDWVGISPKKFIKYLTLEYLRTKIAETENMIDAAEIVGLSSQSRVHDLFVSIEGVSPQQYKTAGKGLEIFYGYHASPFGLCFIAVTEKGICALKFIDEERTRNEFELFSQQWQFADLVHKPDYTQQYIKKIFQPDKTNPEKLNLLIQGTDFQIKVWEALLKIPFGSVSSFQQIAQLIGQPEAARAVGSAVGKNSILYLIPCHRIISGDGTLGNYHFGKVRKQAMIGWEMSKTKFL
ncbi:MAG: methylated-DNA--[protein]-cysteine S-methyltransferase [Flavobacterium sp.]|uniref:bifunctional helix-turn-helix domain-containing protein/methylated-DNA--[protein]-cysteine S-methyltransferase n=1 Tax=Flavobacterium sp. TaxID=239 RepID=UPI001B16E394|nr:methylated-DNA--[protein]-cysteine S-methyltransferase [Flavobacterium sp.]MBO9584816.1 methylated-DNA--[protein]-cysteine S-methyltransferase [Flavobacterium sp.]